MSRAVKYAIVITLVLLLIFGGRLAAFYIDWLWFREVGYTSVFFKRLWTQLAIALVAGAVFFAFAGLNVWLARRSSAFPAASYDISSRFRRRAGLVIHQGIGWLVAAALLVASVFVALEAATHWSQYLSFVNATPFRTKDPVFGNDIGFYIFRLPFWRYIYSWSMVTVVLTAIGVAIIYFTDRAIDFIANQPRIAPYVRAHLLVLLGIFLLIKAIGYRLNAFDILYSPNGAAYGAMYTDIHARLPLFNLLMVGALIAALLIFYSTRTRGWQLPAIAVGGLIALSILAGLGYPGLVQRFKVRPNELEVETPYIRRTISFTRQAFGLGAINARTFPATGTLTAADIAGNQATINNIRLWDYRPTASTYENLQAIRPYYTLKGAAGIDVDRYMVNGQYRQVMLAARELQGTPQIQASWQRNRLQYTHGYGVVMSPASEVSVEGLPVFYISGIPIQTTTDIQIQRPQIYYGEEDNKYVIVGSTQNEFDYPRGEEEVTTTYRGRGGIAMGSRLRRLLFATTLGDSNLILSNAIKPQSRILLRRQIGPRMRTIAPFLVYDRDPYLVVSNGRLFWVQDAYTVTGAYPYSEPHELEGYFYPVNYMRNSVKAVVDAYDGTVNFYVSDPTDPIIRTYARIFPRMFKEMERMPEDIRAHIRYPEDLFRLQALVYATYHMTNPSVFYRKEDVWDFPAEVKQPDRPPMEPYYVIMKLPGETREQFMLIRPFTPPGRPNMIAWMAADCDPPNYGRLTVFQFPTLPYGPEQIEARIDQDATISPQLTLWGQGGSEVIRGNLLVIPIENSLLYVEPIYLQATESRLPELKRVIVAYETRVVMEASLGEALQRIFGGAAPGAPQRVSPRPTPQPVPGTPAPAPTPPSAATPEEVRRLVNQANQNYQRALDAQRRGDWATYGEELRRLENTLRELQQQTR